MGTEFVNSTNLLTFFGRKLYIRSFCLAQKALSSSSEASSGVKLVSSSFSSESLNASAAIIIDYSTLRFCFFVTGADIKSDSLSVAVSDSLSVSANTFPSFLLNDFCVDVAISQTASSKVELPFNNPSGSMFHSALVIITRSSVRKQLCYA